MLRTPAAVQTVYPTHTRVSRQTDIYIYTRLYTSVYIYIYIHSSVNVAVCGSCEVASADTCVCARISVLYTHWQRAYLEDIVR